VTRDGVEGSSTPARLPKDSWMPRIDECRATHRPMPLIQDPIPEVARTTKAAGRTLSAFFGWDLGRNDHTDEVGQEAPRGACSFVPTSRPLGKPAIPMAVLHNNNLNYRYRYANHSN